MNILRALLFLLAILLASITTVAGLSVLVAEITGPEHYVYTQGTVVRIMPDTSQGSTAEVRFTTKQHTTVNFQMPNAFPRYHVGAVLPVKYRSELPTDAYNASFAANGLLGILLLWFALLCIALLSGQLIFRRYIWRQVTISLYIQRRQAAQQHVEEV
ncbi:MAG TPA: DUF3592 domain-containing protein [Ktedonobacteraceae bacterium]|jgi:hypothetical protein